LFAALLNIASAAFADSDVATEDTSWLEEVVVTGSHIHGTEVAGQKLIVIDREQIDASGYGRVEDVLGKLTQNFNRANEAVANEKEVDNSERGAEVQLRGLGLGTTLVLLNGQRQAPSGTQGSFTDISIIPAAAIERIEILADGASALYGSDAIGGVVNFILRKNFTGLETRVRASTAGGDANQREFSQFWGHTWSGGNVLMGYQYYDQRHLACSVRAYCAANLDFRSFGGGDYRLIGGNPGTVLNPDTLAPIGAIPKGQDGTHLTAAQLIPGTVNHMDTVTFSDILPNQSMHSGFLNASYRFADRWELSVGGIYSLRDFSVTRPQDGEFPVPETNAFNHLGMPVLVDYDVTEDLGVAREYGSTDTSLVSTGLKGALWRGWQINLTGSYSKTRNSFVGSEFNYDAVVAAIDRSDPMTAFNVFGDGSHTNLAALAGLRDQNVTFRDENIATSNSVTVIADGPLLHGPAGVIRFAVGGDYRKDHALLFTNRELAENRNRRVSAGFAELAVPLLGSEDSGITAGRLDLSLAGRYENYDDSGTTFNPKVGLSWHPWNLVKLRGTWGTSFRAPPFYWSNPDEHDAGVFDVVDPRSSTGMSRVLALFGSRPGLKPETAEVWTVGMDLAASAARNPSLSLTYFDVDYQGKIHNPGLFRNFLIEEPVFAALITRDPTRAQIDALCKDPVSGQCSEPIVAILDNRFRNLASVKTRGVDASVGYSLDEWDFGLNGTYTFDLKQQITVTAPVFEFVDTVDYPLKLRLGLHVSWSLGGWTAQTTVNYAGRYQDQNFIPARNVDSWTTADLNVCYRTHGEHRWLADSQINLGVNNLLDRRAPFVDIVGYDGSNANLLGREVSLQVVKGWRQ